MHFKLLCFRWNINSVVLHVWLIQNYLCRGLHKNSLIYFLGKWGPSLLLCAAPYFWRLLKHSSQEGNRGSDRVVGFLDLRNLPARATETFLYNNQPKKRMSGNKHNSNKMRERSHSRLDNRIPPFLDGPLRVRFPDFLPKEFCSMASLTLSSMARSHYLMARCTVSLI